MTLKHFKTDLKAVQYMITQSGESSWSLEKSTGISRQTIDRWIKATDLKIRRATLSDFANKLNYKIQYNINGIAVSPHTKKQNTGDLNMEQQQMLIELQAEKIKRLEQKLEDIKPNALIKPAYHFKVISRYMQETGTWYDPLITGDVSMTGYTNNKLMELCTEKNQSGNLCFWLKRYHPDSLMRLNASKLSNIKTDFHYLKWEHMMWKSKNGKYECYNIDQVYSKADQEVTAMFYWVNGDKA